MTEITTITAGIDISKEKLDAAIHGLAWALCVPNDKAGWKKLAAAFKKRNVTRIGLEATGGYERGVLRHLQQAGFSVFRLQPLQVKRFAQMRLQRAKSDTLDAALIAACTVTLDPQHQAPPEARFDAMAGHLTYIEQIEEDIVRQKNRLEKTTDKRLRSLTLADIARLQKRLAAELARLTAAVRAHPDLATKLDLADSVRGIGERTALALVVRMPELGTLSREQAASLAGLAPFVHQSGKHKGQTRIGGGRSRLRGSLYKAAMAAARYWNPSAKALHDRMIARGKTSTSALVAGARKLLVQVNATIARGTPWQIEAPARA